MRAMFCALAAPVLVAVVAGVAFAQSAKPGAPAPKSRGSSRSTAPKGTPAVDAGTVSKPAAPLPAGTATAPAAPVVAADAGVVEAKTLDGGTRVYTFSELDIEGRLKSPQLVYFLRRVRAEFAAGDLGHRSFLGEMSDSRKDPTF
jgi:hypothetical protein